MKTTTTIGVILSILVSFYLYAFELNTDLIYTSQNGKVKFTSKATLEVIKAESDKLGSSINVVKKTFGFTLIVRTFEGFNNPMQKEHFLENYMEADKFKTATFNGKIIEDVDLTKDGIFNVRAKGKMAIHGVEKEKIITARIAIKNKLLEVESRFEIPLDEYEIKIPKMVNQEIAQIILVEMKSTLQPNNQ